jgi:hypothetical protein
LYSDIVLNPKSSTFNTPWTFNALTVLLSAIEKLQSEDEEKVLTRRRFETESSSDGDMEIFTKSGPVLGTGNRPPITAPKKDVTQSNKHAHGVDPIVPLLSVVFDIFSSKRHQSPPSTMRVRALLLCHRICKAPSYIVSSISSNHRQRHILSTVTGAAILKHMNPDESHDVCIQCSIAEKERFSNVDGNMLPSFAPLQSSNSFEGIDDAELIGSVFDDLLTRSSGMHKSNEALHNTKRAHELYTNESKAVSDFCCDKSDNGKSAWLVGDAIVTVRVGAAGSIHDGIAEMILRSSTGRVRWEISLSGRNRSSKSSGRETRTQLSSNNEFKGDVSSSSEGENDSGDEAIDRAKKLISQWDSKEDAWNKSISEKASARIKEEGRFAIASTPPKLMPNSPKRKKITTMSPYFLDRAKQKQEECAQERLRKQSQQSQPQAPVTPSSKGGEDEEENQKKAHAVKVNGGEKFVPDEPAPSPRRTFRHTSGIIDNISIDFDSVDGTVSEAIRPASMKKQHSHSDLLKLAMSEAAIELDSLSPATRARQLPVKAAPASGILEWLKSSVFDNASDSIAINKVFLQDFGYSGSLSELEILNDEEISEVMANVQAFGVKLKLRQSLRRALIELASASRVGKDAKEQEERDAGAANAAERPIKESSDLTKDLDWFTKRTENKDVDNNDVLDPQPPMLTSRYLLENIFNISAMGGKSANVPRMDLLTCNAALDRAITILDRTPPLMTHKIALLFAGSGNGVATSMGEGKETEMISAIYGSPQYNTFCTQLGELVPVRDLQFYSGGLDTESFTDGDLALIWMSNSGKRKKMTCGAGESMIVFHTPTLMPGVGQDGSSNPMFLSSFNNRKRHVGNDTVHIIFSDEPFVMDGYEVGNVGVEGGGGVEKETLKISGQFGLVTIVVVPIAGTGAVQVDCVLRKDLRKEWGGEGFLEHLERRVMLPNSRAAEYVRQLAIRADIACRCMKEEELGSVTWQERLRQIRRLRRLIVK